MPSTHSLPPPQRRGPVTFYRAAATALRPRLAPVDPAILDVFRDASAIAPSLREAVAVAVRLGLARGSGGRLAPDAPVTRAEAVVLLWRAANLPKGA